jgi:hypothetical protein
MIPALLSPKKFIHQSKAEYLRRFNNQEEHETMQINRQSFPLISEKPCLLNF